MLNQCRENKLFSVHSSERTLPTEQARSMVPPLMKGWCHEDQDPQRHMIAERSSENRNWLLIHCMVLLYALQKSLQLVICKPLLLLQLPCLLWWRLVVRMTHFQFLSLFGRRLVSSLAHSSGRIGPEGCSDSLARKGWIPLFKKCALSIITPEAVCCYMKSRTILCCTMNKMFSSDWL